MSVKGSPRLRIAVAVAALVLVAGVFSAVKERPDRTTAMDTVPQAGKKLMQPPGPGHPQVKTEILPFEGVGPFPGDVYDINNVAGFAVDDMQFTVYAGAWKGTNQGVLIVNFVDFGTGKDGSDAFPTPAADGSLTITFLNGSSVGFTTSSGGAAHFDVISHGFSEQHTAGGSVDWWHGHEARPSWINQPGLFPST